MATFVAAFTETRFDAGFGRYWWPLEMAGCQTIGVFQQRRFIFVVVFIAIRIVLSIVVVGCFVVSLPVSQQRCLLFVVGVSCINGFGVEIVFFLKYLFVFNVGDRVVFVGKRLGELLGLQLTVVIVVAAVVGIACHQRIRFGGHKLIGQFIHQPGFIEKFMVLAFDVQICWHTTLFLNCNGGVPRQSGGFRCNRVQLLYEISIKPGQYFRWQAVIGKFLFDVCNCPVGSDEDIGVLYLGFFYFDGIHQHRHGLCR